MTNAPSSDEQIISQIQGVRERYNSGVTQSLGWRRQQLQAISRLCEENEAEILAALKSDLGKPATEAYSAEVGFMIADVEHILKHLSSWMKPRKVKTALVAQPGKSFIVPEPFGVALIIAPWNYPFQLLMAPLASAIAAGNVAVLKPSEMSPATSALVTRLIPQYLDERAVVVIEGGVPETTTLLKQRFDTIFFTGSTAVGRIVMRAAAEHLTPVTLELGGKSPCIVDRKANLKVAAKRIALGKFWNAGQTCVAPDYILVHEAVKDEFLSRLRSCVREFYGDDPQLSQDFGRIVNQRHHKRLAGLLAGANTYIGGEMNEEALYVAPTVLTDVSESDPVMQEEIFGPILPVLSYTGTEEAIAFVNKREKPLALYIFTEDSPTAERVLNGTSSGGASVNHVWLHLAVPELPFGGVGESGMGAYHGQHGFECFSHRRAVLRKGTLVDPPVAYPPFTPFKDKMLKKLM